MSYTYKGKTYETSREAIQAAISEFPPVFGMRAFFGDLFRVSPSASFFSGSELLLYTQVKRGDDWLDFCKGTSDELLAEVVSADNKRFYRGTSQTLYNLTQTHDFKIDPDWLRSCGHRDEKDPIYRPRHVLYVSQFIMHLQWGFIQVSTPWSPEKGWCCDCRRGEWVPKPAPTPKAVLANAQTLLTGIGYYPTNMIVDIPLGNDGLPGLGYRSRYSTPLTMREAKRAMRQLTKIQQGENANGEIEWYEGWANQPDNKPALGLLSFGSFPDMKRGELTAKQRASYAKDEQYGRWDTPEHRHTSAFQNWLYGAAEKLGYEVTDQDQTSRCIDCQLAIDSGSSTPDRFTFVDGEGDLCERCCNNSPTMTIKGGIDQDGIHYLNWTPKIKNAQGFDYEAELLTICFKDCDSAERFARQYAKNHMAISRGCYSWDPVTCYLFSEDLTFQTKDKQIPYTGDGESYSMSHTFGQDTWTATNATIEWKPCYREQFRNLDRQRQDEAWQTILQWQPEGSKDELASLEDVSPLLYWLAQGWIEETPLFESDMAILKQLITDLELREEDLGLELTELEETN